nr:hypothetical protein DM860_005761 [Ipomoea batatas]
MGCLWVRVINLLQETLVAGVHCGAYHRVDTDGVCLEQLSLATSLVPPPLGFLKCWFNAVLDASPSKVSFKMVLFNGQGAFAGACNGFLMCVQDPNLAKALACKESLAWAQRQWSL